MLFGGGCFWESEKMNEPTETPQQDYAALKPCPFCGMSDIDAEGWANGNGDTGPKCLSCGATGESTRAWNKRDWQWEFDLHAANKSFRQWCIEKVQ